MSILQLQIGDELAILGLLLQSHRGCQCGQRGHRRSCRRRRGSRILGEATRPKVIVGSHLRDSSRRTWKRRVPCLAPESRRCRSWRDPLVQGTLRGPLPRSRESRRSLSCSRRRRKALLPISEQNKEVLLSRARRRGHGLVPQRDERRRKAAAREVGGRDGRPSGEEAAEGREGDQEGACPPLRSFSAEAPCACDGSAKKVAIEVFFLSHGGSSSS